MLYIAKNIKALRAEKKLSQAHLASQLGIVPGTISNYENGVSTPDFEMLEKITKILEVSAHDLLYEDLSSENLKTKTPKNLTVENSKEKGKEKSKVPKLQKTLPSEAEVAEPVAGYDPSLAPPQIPVARQENDFAGLTNQQIKDLIREEFDAYLLEQFEAGRIVPAVTARQYQDQIKELTAQVARLEYINQELTVKLQASGHSERAKRNDDVEQKKSL